MYKGPEVGGAERHGSRSPGPREWGRKEEESAFGEPHSEDSSWTSEGSRGPLQGFQQSSDVT